MSGSLTKSLFISVLFLVSVFSCSRAEDSELSEQTKRKMSPDDAHWKRLQVEVILEDDFAKSLEIAFLITTIESDINKKLLNFAQNATKKTEREASIAAWTAYDNMSYLAVTGGSSLIAFQLSYYNPVEHREIYRSPALSIGLSFATTASALLVDKVRRDKNGVLQKDKKLSESELSVLSAQLNNETKASRDFDTIVNFLELTSSDQREFRAYLIKEFVRNYEEAAVHGATIPVENLKTKIKSKVRLFETARGFEPSTRVRSYRQKIDFLIDVERGFETVYEFVRQKNLSSAEMLDIKIDVMKAYLAAIPKVEAIDVNSETSKKLISLLTDRIEALEKLKKFQRN